MADADTIRRREIRKRKILEHSEARLNRITNASKNFIACIEIKQNCRVDVYSSDIFKYENALSIS